MMRAVCLAMVLATALPAAAETQSTMLYQHKHWEVEYVQFADGTTACLAEVDAGTDSFTVWLYQDASFRLQFYSTDWEFGDTGDTADLQIRIDRRPVWDLTNANLYKNSVLFDLPPNQDGGQFLDQVALGNTLYLNTASGEGVKSYSLAGSNASMLAMLDCGNVITGNSSNPFN